ncbi:MAG: phage shock protein C [Candidatus Azotimanducaceae bacterium]
MNRSEREKLEAQREARRTKRLSERAAQRARRQAEQAEQAALRAEQLANRAQQRHHSRDGAEDGSSYRSNQRSNQGPRHRDADRSIEDIVDDVTDKWSRKAEAWMDDQSSQLFGSDKDNYGTEEDYSGEFSDDFNEDYDADEFGSADYRSKSRVDAERRGRRKQRAKRRSARMKAEITGRMSRRWKRRNGNGNLYRNSQNKKICGVCSGIADYWGMSTWQVRMMAVFALFIVPSVAIPGYFIAYFLMDAKPYYRQVTDRFHELDEDDDPESSMGSNSGQKGSSRKARGQRNSGRNRMKSENREPEISNVHALRKARQKFSDIEDRLRSMETHVTSPRFELQRELRKIAGDDA